MRIYMQLTPADEQPPRFYQIHLQRDLLGGWTLVREWGRQGAGGRLLRDHFPTLDEAMNALEAVRDRQLARGYRVMFSEGSRPA